MKIVSLVVGGLLAASVGAACAAPPDLNLLVRHEISELGADGVTRNLSFQERVYRRAGLVWVERVVPAAAHRADEHAHGGHEHKHMDLAAAARWITRDDGQAPRLRLVNAHDRVVVAVPEAEYANVGFDGNWENAVHLLDPRQLKGMRAEGGGWYESAGAERVVRVLWDARAEVPRRVESTARAGNSRRLMVAEPIPAPRNPPWLRVGSSYQQKEYSDYLD